MSAKKQAVRQVFRDAVFKRAKNRCQGPNCQSHIDNTAASILGALSLDAHHITDRNLMPHGGYVAENGIALCSVCHELAEHYHTHGEALPGWHPDDLYRIIGSSPEKAIAASNRKLG